MYAEDAKKLGLTENEVAIIRSLGFQPGTRFMDTIDEAVTHFEEQTNNDPNAMIGLSVFLNTFITAVVRNWELIPKNIIDNEEKLDETT